jgi:DNA-binding transcriptional LysR family regulator
LISTNGKVTATVNLDDSLIFVKVAQVESISQAACSLGTLASAVSPRLSVLEPNLGVSLLTRTTRRAAVTAQVSVRIARKVNLAGGSVAAFTRWMRGD